MVYLNRIINKIKRLFAKRQYRLIENNLEKYNDVWQNEAIPEKQLKLTGNNFLNNIKNDRTVKSLKEIFFAINGETILEIGCSSGYYSEILKKLGLNLKYEGCDYSQKFIALAKQKYPGEKFEIMDATDLKYENDSFDTVFNARCLFHILNYQKAIAESARVSKKYIIFSGITTLHLHKTIYAEKTAYGVNMLEIFFNENELVDLFKKNNLAVIKINSSHYFYIEELTEPIFIKNYLCKKIK